MYLSFTNFELKTISNLTNSKLGMSTAHETTVAHYCGLKVVGMSIITDKVVLESDDESEGLGSSHDEVIKAANKRAKDCEALVSLFFKKISEKTTTTS